MQLPFLFLEEFAVLSGIKRYDVATFTGIFRATGMKWLEIDASMFDYFPLTADVTQNA